MTVPSLLLTLRGYPGSAQCSCSLISRFWGAALDLDSQRDSRAALDAPTDCCSLTGGRSGDVKDHCGFMWYKKHSWNCWVVGLLKQIPAHSGSLCSKGMCVCDCEWAKCSCQGLPLEPAQVGGWPRVWAVFGSRQALLEVCLECVCRALAQKAAVSSEREKPSYSPGVLSCGFSCLRSGGPFSLIPFTAFGNVMVALLLCLCSRTCWRESVPAWWYTAGGLVVPLLNQGFLFPDGGDGGEDDSAAQQDTDLAKVSSKALCWRSGFLCVLSHAFH